MLKRTFAILLLLFPLSKVIHSQVGFDKKTLWSNELKVDNMLLNWDVDGDGDMDILTNSYNAFWIENVNNGVFGPKHILSELSFAKGINIYDLDGDGDMDLLFYISNYNTSLKAFDAHIYWCENLDGKGSFGKKILIANLGDCSNSLAIAADIDGDNDLDIIAMNNTKQEITLYSNLDSHGNFGEGEIIISDIKNLHHILTGDIDNDGITDIISNGDKLEWYKNSGNGNYSFPRVISEHGFGLKNVFFYDINGTGDLDLFSYYGGTIIHKKNNGFGNFEDHTTIVKINQEEISGIALGDLDNDGDLDLAFCSKDKQKANTIGWLKNTDGKFGAKRNLYFDSYFASIGGIAITDINNSGKMDIVFSGKTIGYYANHGNDNFVFSKRLIGENVKPDFVHYSDMDKDGDLDMVYIHDNGLYWNENYGHGQFTAPVRIETHTIGNIEISDIDNNGYNDIFIWPVHGGNFYWLKNYTHNTYSKKKKIDSKTPSSAEFIDFDKDGDKDIVCALKNEIYWYENSDGKGNFKSKEIILSNNEFELKLGKVLIRDLNGDGKDDIVLLDELKQLFAWFENNGSDGYLSQKTIETNMTGMFVVDINRDGNLDVVGSTKGGKLAWFENDGKGDFSLHEISNNNGHYKFKKIVDFDQDGDLDIVIQIKYDLFLYENLDGEGGFSTAQLIIKDFYGEVLLSIEDLNGDHKLDILSQYIDTLFWYKNIGSISNRIKGLVKVGTDLDHCYGAKVSNLIVETKKGNNVKATALSNHGFYQIDVDEGTYVTRVICPDYFLVNPPVPSSSFSGIGKIDTINFCLIPKQTINDLNIVILPLDEPNPGFQVSYQLVYTNTGTTTQNGTINLKFESDKIKFVSSDKSVSEILENKLVFNFENLNPFETQKINLKFEVFTPPVVNIMDKLKFSAIIESELGDFTPNDNISKIDQLVVGSFDPNDILVLEGNEILLDEVDEYLHYIIRFQNTGTTKASQVIVENVLNEHLDYESFQFESSSHASEVIITDQNKISFVFDGIYLPDSTSNKSKSHGFVAYKIKPKPDVTVGDIFLNQANILFDFNQPIETNIVETKIVKTSGIESLNTFNFSIYPNPVSKILNIDCNAKIDIINFYDYRGQQILSFKKAQKINISNLENGIYFCEVILKDSRRSIKKLLKF